MIVHSYILQYLNTNTLLIIGLSRRIEDNYNFLLPNFLHLLAFKSSKGKVFTLEKICTHTYFISTFLY
jgi:hypothetical protein